MSRAGARFRSGTAISGWTRRPTAGIGYGVATGGIGAAQSTGTLGDGFTYNYLTFTATGTLTVTKAGLFDYLICAGGGAGGSSSVTSNIGGGGGAGGIMQGTVYLDANQTVTIGAGGSPSVDLTTQGNSSSIGGARGYSVAGGGAGGWRGGNRNSPNRGGSGGGGLGTDDPGSDIYRTGATAMAPSVSGFAGGNGDYQPGTSQPGGAGGGGGATAVGGNFSSLTGGAGGAGYDVSAFIGGSALFKCAGGGGAGWNAGGAGGSSIGGAGANNGAAGSAAANTASGGGGARNAAGGSGGSGIVYVRFRV